MNDMGDCNKPSVKVEPFVDEPINTTRVSEDTEVDIVNWTNKRDIASNKEEDPDATEYSSSFADTTSDAEMSAELSDDEVDSEELIGESELEQRTSDALGSVFRIR